MRSWEIALTGNANVCLRVRAETLAAALDRAQELAPGVAWADEVGDVEMDNWYVVSGLESEDDDYADL